MTRRQIPIAVLAALGAILVTPSSAADKSAAAFSRASRCAFIRWAAPGGGYDTYMRALIPHHRKEARRQAAADQRAGRRRADRDESHAQRAARRTEHPAGRRRDAGHRAALRVARRELRRAQADLARAREQRGQGGADRSAVALQQRCRHGEERAARAVGRLRQDRRQFRFHRADGPCARHEEQDHHGLQGHRRYEPCHSARRGGWAGGIGGIGRALRAEQPHAGDRSARAQAGGAVSGCTHPVRSGRSSAPPRRA